MTDDELEQLKRTDVQEIIHKNRNENPDDFALKYYATKDLPVRAIAEQIACNKKAMLKLPDLIERQLIFHPISIQQSTGTHLADIKPRLFGMHGNRLLDMTGGLGIDTIYLAQHFNEVTYCEANTLLTKIAAYNFKKLQLQNIAIANANSIRILSDYPDQHFDWLYIDPSRRTSNRRTISMEDSSPNIVRHQELLLEKAHHIAIKLSPAIDLSDVQKKLKHIETIYVISVDGECKEIACILDPALPKNHKPDLKSILIDSATKHYKTIQRENSAFERRISSIVSHYFYEPDAAIIKAHLTVELTKKYPECYFINNQTDFLTSSIMNPNFPGRSFEVTASHKFTKNDFKNYLR